MSRQLPSQPEPASSEARSSVDARTESLVAEIEDAEKWIGPVPAKVRWQAGLTTLLSYGIVGYSVNWDLGNPFMLGLYGISAAALLMPIWLRRKAERRVQLLLDRQERLNVAVDRAIAAGQGDQD